MFGSENDFKMRKNRALEEKALGDKYFGKGKYREATRHYANSGSLFSLNDDNLAAENCYRRAAISCVKEGAGGDYYEASMLNKMADDCLEKVKKPSHSNAAKKIAVLILLSFVFSALILSSNFTGYAAAGVPATTSNWIGGLLFLVGIFGSYFYIRQTRSA